MRRAKVKVSGDMRIIEFWEEGKEFRTGVVGVKIDDGEILIITHDGLSELNNHKTIYKIKK